MFSWMGRGGWVLGWAGDNCKLTACAFGEACVNSVRPTGCRLKDGVIQSFSTVGWSLKCIHTQILVSFWVLFDTYHPPPPQPSWMLWWMDTGTSVVISMTFWTGGLQSMSKHPCVSWNLSLYWSPYQLLFESFLFVLLRWHFHLADASRQNCDKKVENNERIYKKFEYLKKTYWVSQPFWNKILDRVRLFY